MWVTSKRPKPERVTALRRRRSRAEADTAREWCNPEDITTLADKPNFQCRSHQQHEPASTHVTRPPHNLITASSSQGVGRDCPLPLPQSRGVSETRPMW